MVNQCLTPLAVTNLVLMSRKAHEARYLYEVMDQHATRTAVIPWQIDPPVGADHLHALINPAASPRVVEQTLA